MGSDDVSLVSSSWLSEGSQCLYLQGQVIKNCDNEGTVTVTLLKKELQQLWTQ